MTYLRVCSAIAAVLVTASVGFSTTIHVPADSATIQAGINGAVDGDTVLVADGTYTGYGNRDIDFGGREIVVMSENGPGVTIIDAENSGRGFLFQNSETELSVLNGFTVRNGYTTDFDYGGGIYIYTSSPTITDCIISGNYSNYGGGIYSSYASPTVTNCTVVDNIAEISGGGIHHSNGSADINHCVIEGNSSTTSNGGGVYVSYYGGFVGPTISNCTFKDNSADNKGGGLYYDNIEPAYHPGYVWSCIFTGNSADAGCGAYIEDSKVMIYNCLFESNWSDDVLGQGGGIYLYYCDQALIHNCTLANNDVNSYGAGIRSYYSVAIILNCIVYGNNGNGQIHALGIDPTVTYSDIEGGWPGTGNINEDPMFAEEVDYHLTLDSPCVDAGDTSKVDDCFPPGMGGERSDMGTYGGPENCDLLEGVFDLFLYPTGPTTVSVGDTIFFETLFWNSTDNQVTGDYWLSAILPNQMEVLIPEIVLNWPNPLHGSAAAHGSITISNRIWAVFPGTFQVVGRIGVYPNLVVDEETFNVEILP